MGGSGGGGKIDGPLPPKLQKKIDDLKKQATKHLDAEIENFIREILLKFNDRDRELVNQRIEDLHDYLGEDIEIDHILFGGSVAKHTDVDGISDVDALVILDSDEYMSPSKFLDTFFTILDKKLPRSQIEAITKGSLAVTIEFEDGEEIQLLPARRSGNSILIATPDGKNWIDTNPKIFQKELTSANKKMNNALIPSIKLFKSINSDLPINQQLTGYHIEAIAVQAVKNYNGPKTPRALLIQILDGASQSVLSPMRDKTGQSSTIDAYLGKADNNQRKNISQILLGFKRRLEAATSVSQWRSVFE